MMRNKKAWLRIVEAFIAILIITSVLLVVVQNFPKEDKSEEIHKMQRLILEQISLNDSLRKEILDYDEIDNPDKEDTEAFINEIKPAYWNFEVRICEIEGICSTSEYIEKEVYADEIFISSTLQQYNPKKLKLFVWTE